MMVSPASGTAGLCCEIRAGAAAMSLICGWTLLGVTCGTDTWQ